MRVEPNPCIPFFNHIVNLTEDELELISAAIDMYVAPCDKHMHNTAASIKSKTLIAKDLGV
jgi:hypothetical protein